MLTNTLTMAFLEEAPNVELKPNFVEENRGSQPSDDVFNEDKEQVKPATKKARFVTFEPDELDEIVKSSQAQNNHHTKYLNQMTAIYNNRHIRSHSTTFTGKLNLKFTNFVCLCVVSLLC